MSMIQIPAQAYHSHPALGSTSLKRALITPQHYWAFAKENPERLEEEETDALIFGRLAHCLVLENEDVFKRDFIVLPEGLDRRTTAGKQKYADIMADAGLKTVVKHADVEKARAMRKAVEQHFVWKYLKHGAAEGSSFWKDGGLDCKVRLDWVESTDIGNIIIDYKTSKCAAREAFARQMNNLNYHVQTAHYNEGYKAAHGEEAHAFLFVAQDKKAPFAVGAYMVDPAAVKTGRLKRQKALDIIRTGRETGYWPGYTDKIELIDIPTYAQYQAAEEFSEESDDEHADHATE